MFTVLQVSQVIEQHKTMIEAVENHMPDTVIVVCDNPPSDIAEHDDSLGFTAAQTLHCMWIV